MSEEEVLEGLESANAYSTVSLDAPDSGDEDAPAVAESLGMVDDALEGVEYRESLKPLLERLPPREKRILLLRFFGNMTQSQIADRARHLADARVPAAGQDAGPAARGPDHRRVGGRLTGPGRSGAGRAVGGLRQPGGERAGCSAGPAGRRTRPRPAPSAGTAPVVPAALHQVDPDDAGEQLGQQRRASGSSGGPGAGRWPPGRARPPRPRPITVIAMPLDSW